MTIDRPRVAGKIAAAIASIAAGFAVWWAVYILTGKTDPTGEDIYWQGGYPALALLSGVFGFFLGYGGWIFAIGMLATQLVVVLFFSPMDNPQLPIGLMLYVAFAVPLVIVALFGAFVAQRVRR